MRSEAQHPTPESICNAIGRKVVAERMKVGKTAVGNAVADGIFPARWYREMQALCAEHSLECPDDLFNFVRTSTHATARAS